MILVTWEQYGESQIRTFEYVPEGGEGPGFQDELGRLLISLTADDVSFTIYDAEVRNIEIDVKIVNYVPSN